MMKKIIDIYENVMVNYFQKKYNKLYHKLYKYSKISYRLEIKRRSKINKCKISKDEKNAIKKYWKKYTNDYRIYAHMFYQNEDGKKDARFIPDDIYAEYIEQHFNNAKLAPAFSDKNYFDLYLNGFNMPKTYVHYIDRSFLDSNYNIISKKEAYNILLNAKEFVVKRSIGTSGGAGVRVIEKVNKKILDSIFNEPKNCNLLFQERIKQYELLNSFSKNSINTIRIYTYWFKDKIYLSSAVLRAGKNDSLTDNSSSGGVFFRIDKNDYLIKTPRNIDGFIDDMYRFNNELGEKVKLDFMGDIKKFVVSAASRLAHFKIIAWDIAVTEDKKPILIEYNVANTIPDINQMSSKPFFGDLTDDILDEVFLNKKNEKEGIYTDQYI